MSVHGQTCLWHGHGQVSIMLLRADIGTSLVLSVYLVTFVTGFPANVFAFCIFFKKVRQKAKPIDVLLLYLIVSDLLFLLFLPFKIHEAVDNMKWNMPKFLCPLSRFVFFGTIYNSLLTLTAISVDRYLAVAFPIKYKLGKLPWYAVLASLFFLVAIFTHGSIIYIITSKSNRTINQTDSIKPVCYKEFSRHQLDLLLPVRMELFLVFFCVPFLTCSFCYISFVRILSQRSNINTKKRYRAIGLALATLAEFVICFAPYNVSHAVGFAHWNNPPWRELALLTSVFNACLDPFVIYFSSTELRRAFRVLLQKLSGRLERLQCCPKALHCPWLTNSEHQDATQSAESTC